MAEMVTAPTGQSLARLADAALERTGGDSVLFFEGRAWRADELAGRARRLAGGLRAAGLAPGDRVVVCMANCPEVGVAYQAVWRAGAVVTPVLFLLSEDELRHVLVDSEAAFAVTTPDFLPKVLAAGAGVSTLRGVIVAETGAAFLAAVSSPAAGVPLLPFADLEAHDESPIVDRDPTEIAALLYTGGTTGRSKGVMISNDAMSASAWAAIANSADEEAAAGAAGAEPIRGLLPLPLSHAYGLMVSTLALHATEPGFTVLMRWFDPTGWLALAQEHRITISAVVPSMLQMVLAQPVESYDLSALRRIASGGAPLARETADEVRRRLPQVAVSQGYGCTESAAIIATSPTGAAREGSVGVPVPGVELRIERADGTDAKAGEDGEICVRGPMLMAGYWHSPGETAYALRGGWLHTGDLGHLDDDGYLFVVDRIKDLIIRGGFNVFPSDIEDALLGHPDVVGAAVVGRPDPRTGEEVVAFVQVRPGATVTPAEIVAFGREHLSSVKYPREVHLVDAIPLTSVGKTDRKVLRARLTDA